MNRCVVIVFFLLCLHCSPDCTAFAARISDYHTENDGSDKSTSASTEKGDYVFSEMKTHPISNNDSTQSPSKENVLSRIPGQCKVSPLEFDCGNGVCIPIKKWRDCHTDCPDGIDEECWNNQVKCDGCKCVDPGEEQTKCRKQ